MFSKVSRTVGLITGLLFGGSVMAGEVISDKEQSIADIAYYAAAGQQVKLADAIGLGLDQGLSVNEAKEILIQLYAYCGFPRSLNALSTLMNTTNARKALGKKDKIGTDPEVLKDVNMLKKGEETQTELVGAKVEGPLFDFVPTINDYLKSHLFGDIFSRGVLSHTEREIATIAALSAIEGVEPQLNAHIAIGKRSGLSDDKVNAILALHKDIKGGVFGKGALNEQYAKFFIGNSYLKAVNTNEVSIYNVTFEPSCRNNWHIHHKGGQILLVTSGRGYYQEWGKPAVELHPGDSVYIAPEVKHWHGAAKDSWFSHLALEVPNPERSNEWLEPVSDEEYGKLR